MSKNLRDFTEAVYAFDAVVARTNPDSWMSPTPCHGWTALDVLGHQIAVLNGVKQMAVTGQVARPIPTEDLSDPRNAWVDCRAALLEALDQKSVLAQPGPFWFESDSIDDLIRIVKWDPATHAWDLATSSGQNHGLSDALLQSCYETIEPMSNMLVASNRIAESRPGGSTASTLDRYLGLVGRDPS